MPRDDPLERLGLPLDSRGPVPLVMRLFVLAVGEPDVLVDLGLDALNQRAHAASLLAWPANKPTQSWYSCSEYSSPQ